jgi:hypothetical protein
MSAPGLGTTWWERNVWDRDDAALGLHAAYQPVLRRLLAPLCRLGLIKHLQGPCGICARGHDPDDNLEPQA